MKNWYVLRSKPKKESFAAGLLERAGIEVYLPQIKTRGRVDGTHTIAPLFPGYFFSRLDPLEGEIRLATYTSGVRYVVGYAEEPCPVPETLIATIRERLRQTGVLAPMPGLRQGDQLVITSGPLQGVEAVFDRRLSNRGRVRVLVHILEHVWRTELHIEQLRSVGKAPR